MLTLTHDLFVFELLVTWRLLKGEALRLLALVCNEYRASEKMEFSWKAKQSKPVESKQFVISQGMDRGEYQYTCEVTGKTLGQKQLTVNVCILGEPAIQGFIFGECFLYAVYSLPAVCAEDMPVDQFMKTGCFI